MLAGEGTKLIGLRRHFAADPLCVGRRAEDDDPRLHGRTELVLVGLGDLLGRRLDLGVRQSSQGDHRPDDLVGILLRGHATLVADELDPLLAGEIEPFRHHLDLGIDLLRPDGDPQLPAALLDDHLVDDRLEDRGPMAGHTFIGELRLRDFRAVDHRGELPSRGLGGGGSLRIGPFLARGGARCRGRRRGGSSATQQGDLSIGLRVARPHAPGEAGKDNHRSTEQARRPADAGGRGAASGQSTGHGIDERPPRMAHRKPSLDGIPASCRG